MGNNPCARARTKVLALLFVRHEAPIRMREVPLGMLVTYTHITPRDDSPTRKVMIDMTNADILQGWAKEISLGCVNTASWLPLATRREFTQPRDHLLACSCTLRRRSQQLP